MQSSTKNVEVSLYELELLFPHCFLNLFFRCIDEDCNARVRVSASYKKGELQFVYVSELDLTHSCGILHHVGRTAASRKRFLIEQKALLLGNLEETIDATPSNIKEASMTHFNSKVSGSVAQRTLQGFKDSVYGSEDESYQKVKTFSWNFCLYTMLIMLF